MRVFDGKRIWITGASSGIGEALALGLAERGARLILSARRESRLIGVRDRCLHPELHEIQCLDLGEWQHLHSVVQEVLRVGPVDAIFHCAGISQRSLARDTRLDVDASLMDVNYFGAVALTKAILPSMLQRGSGRIVVVSSLVGKFGTPLRSGYAASKHALHGFFDSLRAEIHGSGVCITIVCPGFVRTELSVAALTGDGSPLGTMDRAQSKAMTAEVCTRRILRAVERNRSEVYIGGREVLGIYIKRWWPGFFEWLIRRVSVT